jgi:effector-binding domain-containing protein
MECEHVVLESRPALTMRWQTTFDGLPRAFDETFATLKTYFMEIGETPSGPPFAMYHNIDGQNVDVELGVPVDRPLPGRDRIQASELPGGDVVTSLVVGPYDQLPGAYAALMNWMEAQGYVARSAPFEQYLNDPSSVPPEQYETRISFPVQSAPGA